MNFKTEQENFWSGEFGNEYNERNKGDKILAANLSFFPKALKQAGLISSCIEFGANIGMNLKAIKLLYPGISLSAVEINSTASKILEGIIGKANVYSQSILDYDENEKYDIALIRGVLIHINPAELDAVYEKLYLSSRKYILMCEYYNPSPTTVSYRGHENKLFKRDFGGEFMNKYEDVSLVDYGFVYHRDPAFPQDDITWWLFEKK